MTKNTNTAATSGDAPASRYVLAEHEIGGIIGYWYQTSKSRYELCRAVETAVIARIGRATKEVPADLQQLKALALAATPGPWVMSKYCTVNDAEGVLVSTDTAPEDRAYIAAANPAVVLGLIARIERLTTIPEQAPSTEQEWAKVDPAVAFHLIERHAEDWADAGRMMEAWRSAVSAATKPTAPRQAMQEAWQVLMDAGIVPGPEATSLASGIRSLLATKPTADLSKAPVVAYTKVVHQGWPEYNRTNEFSDGSSDGAALVKLADVQSLLATKPAAAAPEVPTDEQIVAALHSCGIDTRPSKYGFDALQIDGASVPGLREVFVKLLATPAASTTGAARTAEQVRDAERYQYLRDRRFICGSAPEHGTCWVVSYHHPKGTIPEMRSAGYGAELDAAIDAAMARPTPTHSSEAGDGDD